jgi:hypothetical protein
MPRVVSVTPEQVEWLRANHTRLMQTEMAAHIGCCVDTLKRILVRHGIVDFGGAKYCVADRSHRPKTWNRPCMRCKSTASRPRNQYICDTCHGRDPANDDSVAHCSLDYLTGSRRSGNGCRISPDTVNGRRGSRPKLHPNE